MSPCNTPALISKKSVSPSGVITFALVFSYIFSMSARSFGGTSYKSIFSVRSPFLSCDRKQLVNKSLSFDFKDLKIKSKLEF